MKMKVGECSGIPGAGLCKDRGIPAAGLEITTL
jgi:hypothetical protein